MSSGSSNLRFWIAAAAAAIAGLVFAREKALLGIDFTDEGLYVTAPMRLAMGEPLFSSEVLTLIRPFEVVAQFLFLLPGSPSLYEFRLIGWLLHIGAYIILAWMLFRECRSVAVALLASAVPFFVSFAWPSTIATPSYKSLSTDFMLVFLACYYASHRWPAARGVVGLRIAAGLAIFLAAICYPPLVLLFAGAMAFDLWCIWRSPPGARQPRLALTTLTGAAVGILVFVWLAASGAIAHWLDRISLTQSFSLTAVRTGGPSFYGHLFGELFTKMEAFTRVTKVAGWLALFLLVAPKRTLEASAALVLILFQVYTLYVLGNHYHGPAYADHFFFPMVYCLAAVTWTALLVLVEARLGRAGRPISLLCTVLSIAACLLYATATYFFDYYYSWNNGVLGLSFAFAFALVRPLGLLVSGQRRWRWLLVAGLAMATVYAECYNHHGVRRDGELPRLTATFSIPRLQGIRSTPERVQSVEALYRYLDPLIATDRRLLVFDHAPMLYFALNAKPAYGLAWAMRNGVASGTHEQLVQEFLARPRPKYAVRTMINLGEPEWRAAPPLPYDQNYLLYATVSRLYRVDRTIYPFEILVLK